MKMKRDRREDCLKKNKWKMTGRVRRRAVFEDQDVEDSEADESDSDNDSGSSSSSLVAATRIRRTRKKSLLILNCAGKII